ncbi:phospholipase D-like domain-containing protein [Pontibacter mangrovi]|uniref:phospholipase D n=1 Tax=Pontibacter mangrovi TaxID=2589816 RepID=A0A501VX93_9BACT|nr:phospholipase D-like domain-containing protein [Pontibacter mangrovi]TPE41052.1 hypothetical protein FJM65_19600 [Pontibacter mangrovi]
MHYLKTFLFISLLAFVSACGGGSEDSPATPKEEVSTELVPYQGTFPQAMFTSPAAVAGGSYSTEIMDNLVALIDATPDDATLYMSIYLFDYKDLVEALERAAARGVELHLMLDLSREDSQKTNPYTIDQLKTKLPENTDLVIVDSDASATAINHNKFVLFSKLTTQAGSATNVVLQTSHNFVLSGTRKMQDGVVLSHEGLYQAFKSYWEDMKKGAKQGMKNFSYREFHDEAAGVSAYFLPKRQNGEAYGEDAVIELLDRITDPATATVRIGMSDWTATRINVVEKLGELHEQGATIELVVKSSIDADVLRGLRTLEEKGVYLKVYNMTESGQAKVNIHSKFMLIEGEWEGEQAQVLVTGSHNFTLNALRNNNETILLLKNSALYNDYIAYYTALKAAPGL